MNECNFQHCHRAVEWSCTLCVNSKQIELDACMYVSDELCVRATRLLLTPISRITRKPKTTSNWVLSMFLIRHIKKISVSFDLLPFRYSINTCDLSENCTLCASWHSVVLVIKRVYKSKYTQLLKKKKFSCYCFFCFFTSIWHTRAHTRSFFGNTDKKRRRTHSRNMHNIPKHNLISSVWISFSSSSFYFLVTL